MSSSEDIEVSFNLLVIENRPLDVVSRIIEPLRACMNLRTQTVTIGLQKEKVKLAFEYNLSKNFLSEVETDSEEFVIVSNSDRFSEDCD